MSGAVVHAIGREVSQGVPGTDISCVKPASDSHMHEKCCRMQTAEMVDSHGREKESLTGKMNARI